MKIEEIKNTQNDYHAKIIFLQQDIENNVQSELDKIQRTAKMDGFRPGKVPMPVLTKKYYLPIRNDIIEKKLKDTIKNITEDQKLEPVSMPMIKDVINEDKKDFSCLLEYELMPKIKIPDFKSISIERPILELKEKDINDALDALKKNHKVYDQEVKTKSKLDDMLVIDAEGFIDGEAFEGGKLKDHQIVLGSNAFIPGFEDQLVGKKKGDDVLVKVDFPKDYHAEHLAGKPSEFKVKILNIKRAKEVEIDDEFAKKNNCKDLADLKTKVSETMHEQYSEHILDIMKISLFDQLEKILDYHTPKTMLEQEALAIKKQTINEPEIQQKTPEEQEKYFNKLAKRRIQIGFLCVEYGKQNNIKISQEDFQKAVIKEAQKNPMHAAQIFEAYTKNQNAMDSLRATLVENKSISHMIDSVLTVKEKNIHYLNSKS